MKKYLFYCFLMQVCLGFGVPVFAQDSKPICGTDAIYQNNPVLKQELTNKTLSLKNARVGAVDPNTIFTVPVVFIVYHLGEAVGTGSNLSDAKITGELATLNDAFRARNTFTGLNDSKIQFSLAQYDANCASASGIVRVDARSVAGYEANGVTYNDDGTMLQALRALHNWNNRDEYITIELVHKLNGAAGYAGYLSGFLVINAPSYWWGLTAHEMGHCLNLRHTFEGDNGGSQCPPNANPETQGDLISDTDPHKSTNFCLNSGNSETDINECSGVPFGKLLRNLMSYNGPCWDRFTPKQVERMRNSLVNFKPQWTASKALTGLTTPPISNTVERCGPGTVTLTASGCTGTYNWYANAGGGIPIGTNAAYTTPNLTAGTTYYVSCVSGNCPESGRTPVSITIKPAAIAQPSSCIPTATNGLSNYFGISAFSFSTIVRTGGQSTSSIGSNYSDLGCSVSTTVQAGNTYPFTLSSLFNNTVLARIYIDFNNNGSFAEADEWVYNGSSWLGTHTGNITIPTSATTNTGLRMRVMLDPSTITPCSLTGSAQYGSGRAEDYAITITPSNCTPPAAPAVNSVSINSGQTATLTASNCTGSVKWYNQQTGGTLLYTGNPYTTAALTVSTPYYASCTVNNCESTTRGSGTVMVSTGTCAVPTGTSWGNRTTRSFWAFWNGIAGHSYVVRYRVYNTSTWTELSPVLCSMTGTFTYRLTNLPSGTSFEWQVKAVCSAGNESAYTNTVFSSTLSASGPCPLTLTHGTGLLPAGAYPAAQNIVSQADVRNNTKYTAGKSVLLQPGFKVNSTQPFTATIEGCPTELPVLQYVGKENIVINGQNYIKYNLSITNASTFPTSMFVASPNLSACGTNTAASRSYVTVYGVVEGSGVISYCGFYSPSDMSSLSFSLPANVAPPTMVYVELWDRLLGLWYASNIVNVQ